MMIKKIDETPNEQEEISKSQLKRDMQDLQKIGEKLVSLSDSQLAKIPLPETLLEAIQVARTLKAREALRRQLQYIGKYMRHVDVEEIQLALKKIQYDTEEEVNQFHLIEQWRDRLIAKGDEALQEFMVDYPGADKQVMRQLIRKAQHDEAVDKSTGAKRKLFIYLRELIQ